MNLNIIRTDQVYRQVLTLSPEQGEALFRKEVLAPFRGKFARQGLSIEAGQGADALQILSLANLTPFNLQDQHSRDIEALDDSVYQGLEEAFRLSIDSFEQAGIHPPCKEYVLAVLLGKADSPVMRLNDNYLGEGGIPGYIFLSLVPCQETLRRLPAALAHECNHNVRYQFVDWQQGALKELMIAEGLAENFVLKLYGPDYLGPWVTKTDLATLDSLIKPKIKANLDISNLYGAAPYLYGDELTQVQGGRPVGLPYAAGYSCGYHLVRYYLKKTGMSVEEASLKTADEILAQVPEFWEQPTSQL